MPCIGLKKYKVTAIDRENKAKEEMVLEGYSVNQILQELREDGYSVYPKDVKYIPKNYISLDVRLNRISKKDLSELVVKIVNSYKENDPKNFKKETKSLLSEYGVM